MEEHRFNLHLPGLLKVLAEHLYSTKKVGVRELIQSAHDSCVRRKIEEGTEARFWKLAQSLSALYPKDTDEKRWVQGVLARKKGFGL